MRHNCFDMNQQSQHQALSPVSTTKQELINHFGPSLDPEISYIISKDIDELQSPVAQSSIDIWHQSGAKTWQQFTNNSSLQNIRKYDPSTYFALQNYQTSFTQNIYSPLSPYTSSRRYSFEGNANTLLHQIHQIYNYLTTLNIPSNATLQIDVRSFHNISVDVESDNDELDEWHCIDIDDIEYELKNSCNIQNNSLHSYEFDNNINDILKQCIINDSKCNYKRYELL
eukprot:401493_1